MAFKVVEVAGRAARACAICLAAKAARWYRSHRTQSADHSRQHKRRVREAIPIFEEGIGTVSASWLMMHATKVPDLLDRGELIVEIHGAPAYRIMRLQHGAT